MRPKSIIVSANLAWNLTNFRSGIIRALIAKGYHVVAAAPPDSEQQGILEEMGCEFWPISIDSKGSSIIRDIRTWLAYAKMFRCVEPIAYLSWTIKPNIYGAIAARLFRVRSIINVSGLGTAFIRETRVTRVVSFLYRISIKCAAVVFFQNSSDRDLFVSRSLAPKGKTLLVAGSGIDTLHFHPAQSTMRPRARFIMITRLLADKGVGEYVAAARLVRAIRPDAKFILAGFLEVENRTAITRSEVSEWVREGVIEYLPPVKDVRPLIESADCVVLPSYREGTARVLLEASAMGRPVIATDVPGCREVVDDGKTGYLCLVKDPDALARAFHKILELNDESWRAMGNAGRRKVTNEFAESSVIAAYLDAIADS